jgi:gamma-carbonic anhydrase
MHDSRRPPILLPYGGVEPQFLGPPAYCAAGSAILGRATIGAGALFGDRAVVRADGNYVTAGSEFCLGPRSTVHIAHDTYPTIVGERVVTGTNALIHACTVGSDVAIGDDVVLLDGCVLGDGTIVESGSVVTPRARLAGGMWSGVPAKRVRDLGEGEIATRAAQLRAATISVAGEHGDGADVSGCLYVASNARIRGPVRAAGLGSIWFGCEFDARDQAIELGEGCNVQDNSRIACTSGPVTIGPRTVIGHNVNLESCAVGAGALLGNGCVLKDGTVVEDGVLVAAGAWTEPGQRLTAGMVWAGRPARPRFAMTQERVDEIADIVRGYIAYARDFAVTAAK